MLKKLIVSALAAGFGAGLILAVLQITLLSPLILDAENYESGRKFHYAGVVTEIAPDHNDGHDAMAHAAEAANAATADAPTESWASRSARTALSTTLTELGFAFVLIAGFGLAARSGIEITARSGVLWGLAGFGAVVLAPSLGLPPELPASAAAPLHARQLWWVGTVIASTAGIAAIAFGKNWAIWGAGIVLLALPHIIGAPMPEAYGGVVPPEMQGEFVGLSIGVSAISWAMLGLIGGYVWAKQPD